MKNSSVIAYILVLIIVLIGGLFIYQKMQEPRTLGENIDSAAGELKQGNVGNAVQELGTQTEGEKLQNDVQQAVSATNP